MHEFEVFSDSVSMRELRENFKLTTIKEGIKNTNLRSGA